MRLSPFFLLALSLAGCPSNPGTDAGPGTDTPAASDTPVAMDVPSAIDAPTTTDTPAATDTPTGADTPATGEPPVIVRVAWTTPSSCRAANPSDYTVTTTVTDADTAAGSLTIMGSVGGCSGTITAPTATINCPNFAPYGGTLTVSDPEGNMDSVMFTIAPCTDGMVEP
jgi:hypothetical protein